MPIRPIDPSRRPKSSPTNEPVTARVRVRAQASPQPPEEAPQPSPKRLHHVVDRTTDNWDEHGDYIVGKGRPPVATRWQKGQSGNPRGPKPREVLDPQALFQRELLATFKARVNNADVELNLGTFALNLLKSNAAKGGTKAQQLLLDLFLSAVGKAAAHDDTPEVYAWEQEVIDQMLAEYGLPPKPVVRKERERHENLGEEE